MSTFPPSMAAGPSRSPFPAGQSWLPPLDPSTHATSPAFDHPYAPLPHDRKGKARAAVPQTSAVASKVATDDEIRALQSIRQSLQAAKGIVSKGYAEGGKARSGQNLRDVVQTEAPLLSLSSTLSSLPIGTNRISPLDPLTSLAPVEALSALSRGLGLDAFIEDSQFGLLKTSLSLAGGTCVVDVDLEIDALDGADGAEAADEDDEMGEGSRRPSAHATPGIQPLSALTTPIIAGRGRVRLSKLSLNYQTSSDSATDSSTEGKSEWIAEVLRDQIGRYIQAWNESIGRDRRREIAKALQAVKGGLRELKAVDELVKAQGRNWFTELDRAVADLSRLGADKEGLLYDTTEKSVFPTFHLLPLSRQKGVSTDYTPAMRFRPTYLDEMISIPQIADSTSEMTDELLGEGWVVEVPDSGEGSGLVVRPSWLDEGSQPPVGVTGWDGPFRVEQYLYIPSTPSFPYLREFAAPSPDDAQVAVWSIARPGPQALVVGRIGLPTGGLGIQHILRLLKRQVVLNTLFHSIFHPRALKSLSFEDEERRGEEDLDLMALLSAPPKDLAVTVLLGSDSIELSYPLHAALDDSSAGETPLLRLTLRAAAGGESESLLDATAGVTPPSSRSAIIETAVVQAVIETGELDLPGLLTKIAHRIEGLS